MPFWICSSDLRKIKRKRKSKRRKKLRKKMKKKSRNKKGRKRRKSLAKKKFNQDQVAITDDDLEAEEVQELEKEISDQEKKDQRMVELRNEWECQKFAAIINNQPEPPKPLVILVLPTTIL